jgi:hypothetical protein
VDATAKLHWAKTLGVVQDMLQVFGAIDRAVSMLVGEQEALEDNTVKTVELSARELALDRDELVQLDDIGATSRHILTTDVQHLSTSEDLWLSITGARSTGPTVLSGEWAQGSLAEVLDAEIAPADHSVPFSDLEKFAAENWEQDRALYTQITAGATSLSEAETISLSARAAFRQFELRSQSAGVAPDLKKSADVTAATAAEVGRTLAMQVRQSAIFTHVESTHTLATTRDQIMSRSVVQQVQP